MSQEQFQYLALAFVNLERLSILSGFVTTVTVFPSPADAYLDPGFPSDDTTHLGDSVTYTVTRKYTDDNFEVSVTHRLIN